MPPLRFIALLLAIAAPGIALFAQQPPRPKPTTMAVVDIRQLLDNCTRFKAAQAQIQADAQRANGLIQVDNQAILGMVKRIQGLKADSDEYKALAQDIAKRQQDLRVRLDVEKKALQQREAAVFHQAYQEIRSLVHQHAQKNGIDAVLSFRSAPADPAKPEEVLQEVNQPVVWSTDELNITPAILAALNGLPAPSRPTASTGQGSGVSNFNFGGATANRNGEPLGRQN